MPEPTLTVTTISKLLAPLAGELLKASSGKIKGILSSWSASSGLKNAAKILIRTEKVKTIWSPEKEIPLQKFYYPSKIVVDNHSSVISSMNDLPSGNLVVEGIVGQGKSIFMRHLSVSLLSQSEITAIPVFIELRTISKKRSLSETIYMHLDSLGVSAEKEVFSYLASSGKIVLLLDGFDEVPEDQVSEVLIELEMLQTKFQDLRIIVSSRPNSGIQNSRGFGVLELQALENDDYEPFLRRLGIDPVKRFNIIEAIEQSPANISGIINTPLMLTLVVIVYETEKEIPVTLAEFFDKLFSVVFTRHDRLKAGFNRQHFSGLTERRLQELFSAFCFMVIKGGHGRSLTEHEFNVSFDRALKCTLKDCEVENFKKDIIKVACLMLEEGIDMTTFLHKSILDYHAAAFIKNSRDKRASSFYANCKSKYRHWEHVLAFLESIDSVRYNKYFMLETLPVEMEKLAKLVSEKDDDKLIEYIGAKHPKLSMGVKNYQFEVFGPMSPSAGPLQRAIDDAISDACFGLLEAALNDNEIDRAIAMNRTGNPGIVHPSEEDVTSYMDIYGMIKVFGAEKLWVKLKIVEAEFIYRLERSRNIVLQDESQERAFEELILEGFDYEEYM